MLPSSSFLPPPPPPPPLPSAGCHILEFLIFPDYFLYFSSGEVSDTNSSDSDVDLNEEFDDGLDENMIGDEEDRARLEQMTEKEREQEIYNRIEKREVMRTRFEIEKKLKLAKKKEQKKRKEKEGDKPKVCIYVFFCCCIFE